MLKQKQKLIATSMQLVFRHNTEYDSMNTTDFFLPLYFHLKITAKKIVKNKYILSCRGYFI